MFKPEFDEIKESVKEFRIADEIFKRPILRQYAMPGVKE
jgi:hypothetical protein